MPRGHCGPDWSERNVTRSNRRAADKAMDRHVAKSPKCQTADVCVHAGSIFASAHCCGCGKWIG